MPPASNILEMRGVSFLRTTLAKKLRIEAAAIPFVFMVAAHRVDGFVCRPHDLVPVVLRFFDSLASSLRNILLHAGPKTISASTKLHGRSYRVTLEYASDYSTERGRPATRAHHVSSVIARHETTATTDTREQSGRRVVFGANSQPTKAARSRASDLTSVFGSAGN